MPQLPDRPLRVLKESEANVRAAKIIGVVIVAVVVLLTLLGIVGTSFRKTPADKIALSYGGGPFEGAQFQKVVEPGSGLVLNGVFDKWYEYPTTQRNYIISRRASEGDVVGEDFITAATD